MEELYRRHRTHASFYVVYIREAHPTDGWQTESNVDDRVEFAQPTELSERKNIADACSIGLKLTIPTLLDSMDNIADLAYQGWPERLYVISTNGKIAYKGGKGPYGFDIDELDRFLCATQGSNEI